MQNTFLIYGANGYTGELITRFAVERGLKLIVAGRNENAIKELAHKHELEHRIFALDERDKLDAALQEVELVLHCAGPFSLTSKLMVEACLRNKKHYTDITGEISVFEACAAKDKKAQEAGIMIMPGAGFDVVPTDCLALHLKNRLPDATKLSLAFASLGGALSHGTAMTMAESLGEGGAARENGVIVKKPLGHKGREIDFGPKKLFVMAIPWGDVSTAFHTTGIPDITVYTSVPKNIFRVLKLQPLFNWLLKTSAARNFFRKQVNKRPAGPSKENRLKSKSLVWGEVENANGEKCVSTLVSPDGYTLTAYSSLIIAEKAINGNFIIGYQTPGSAYGEDLVLEVPGVKRQDVEPST